MDLLLIDLDDETRHVSVGQLSMFLYPWHKLEHDSRNGDLFACHLVREAKPLFDPEGCFPKLKEAFRFRSDYMTEIAHATDFGWYLARFGEELNSHLQVKRALWCIRTILIARSAERRDPVFASQLLAEQTHSVAGRKLLAGRRGACNHPEVRHWLRAFLEEETAFDPFYDLADRHDLIQRFRETSNKVALQTLHQEEQSRAGYR